MEKKVNDPGRPVTFGDLQSFRTELLRDLKKAMGSQPAPLQKPFLKSHEVRRLLKISQGTLQHLRDSGKLKFSKVGGIIFYTMKDVMRLVENQEQE